VKGVAREFLPVPLDASYNQSMSAQSPVVHSDPEILGGTPVFVGTRVPLRNLIDYLERGHSLDEFLDEFPSVSRAQAIAALEAATPNPA
jgi:uncharacterized protein (DUF433 family)